MEEMNRARFGEGAQSFTVFSECTVHPESPRVHQLEPLNVALLVFCGRFITQA